MTRPYRKRMKGSWHQGKRCKGDGEERQFSKQEIKDLIAEIREDFRYKYKKSKRVPNVVARLEYRIKYYEEILDRYKGRSDWSLRYYESHLREAREKLKALKDKEENAQNP